MNVWRTKRQKAKIGEVKTINGKQWIRVICKAGWLQWKLIRKPETIKSIYTKEEAFLMTKIQRRHLKRKGAIIPDVRGLHLKGKKQSQIHIEHRRISQRKYLFDVLSLGKDQKARIRKSPEYKNWRTFVFKRDNYTCQKCNARSGNGKEVYLEAHHKKSYSKYPQLRFDVSNGITLCLSCHKIENKKQMRGNKNGKHKLASS